MKKIDRRKKYVIVLETGFPTKIKNMTNFIPV